MYGMLLMQRPAVRKLQLQLQTYNFVSLHHVVKLFVDPLVLLLSGGREDVGAIGVRAVTPSVLLLVEGLWVK